MKGMTWWTGALALEAVSRGAACAVLIVTLWISSAIETRLLRSVTGSELSVRKAFSNAGGAGLAVSELAPRDPKAIAEIDSLVSSLFNIQQIA